MASLCRTSPSNRRLGFEVALAAGLAAYALATHLAPAIAVAVIAVAGAAALRRKV